MEEARRPSLHSPEVTSAWLRSRLAVARVLAGVTQSGLARAIGLSPAWVSGVEHGTIIPTLQQRIEMARALEMDHDAIFSDGEAD
jgi:transcriptional regulator with XRE-family HTH domain